MLYPSVIENFARKNRLKFTLASSTLSGVVEGYVFSYDMQKRYAYCQFWDDSKPRILWILLNPGLGETEKRRRNTLERCKRWSKDWGFGGLFIGNLFAIRTKSAKELADLDLDKMPDHLNEAVLLLLIKSAHETILAWGNNGRRYQRMKHLAPFLDSAKCLGLTAVGQPRHPLYVPIATPRAKWIPGDA